jgi:hypothetical protein
MINEISLEDVAQNIVCSSFNTNSVDLSNVGQNVYKTAGYIIISINKPVFFVELQEKINGN